MTRQLPAETGLHVLEVSGLAAGGVRVHLGDCARLLAGEGHRVVVAAPGEVLAGLGAGGARTQPLEIGPRPRPRDVAVVARLRRLAGGADVVHAHGLRAGALAALALGGRCRRRVRLVVTLHNLVVGGALSRAVGDGLEALVAARADTVLVVSPDLAQRMAARGAPGIELAVVPAPPEAAAGSVPQEGRAGHQPAQAWRAGCPRRVLTVARLAPQKGLTLLLDTAAVLSQQVAAGRLPAFTWAVAGEGPGRARAQQRIDAQGLPVRLLGRSEDVPALLSQADVVVQTSLWEGQPLAVQEALRAGAAVVATDVGGTAVTARGGAVLVAPRVQEVAQAVGALLADLGRRDQARRRARAAADRLPTTSDLLAQLSRVLDRQGKGRGGR